MRTGEEFTQERQALRQLFPRGRFLEENGACALVSRHARKRRDRLYVHSPGKLLGLFHETRRNGREYHRRLGGLVVDWLRGDEDGILLIRWDAKAADILREFSKDAPRNPTGAGGFRQGIVCRPILDSRTGDLAPT